MEYRDEYPTCSYTHAWLRVMHDTILPAEITRLLGVEPDKVQTKGEPYPGSRTDRVAPRSGWYIESEGKLESYDARRHIDWILDRLGDKATEIQELQSRGSLVDLCCRWDSKSGHGGPTLSPSQLRRLAALGIDVWFDVYFIEEDEEETQPESGHVRK